MDHSGGQPHLPTVMYTDAIDLNSFAVLGGERGKGKIIVGVDFSAPKTERMIITEVLEDGFVVRIYDENGEVIQDHTVRWER